MVNRRTYNNINYINKQTAIIQYMNTQLPTFSIIVAFSKKERGIGYRGTIPWSVPEDMKFFRTLTKQRKNGEPNSPNVLIMGKNTYKSLPNGGSPLPDRINICVSSTLPETIPLPHLENIHGSPSINEIICMSSFSKVLRYLEKQHNYIGNIFVIGGEQLYRVAMYHPQCHKIYANVISLPHTKKIPPFNSNLSQIDEPTADCGGCPIFDTFFPEINPEEYDLAEETPLYPFGELNRVVSQLYKRKQIT